MRFSVYQSSGFLAFFGASFAVLLIRTGASTASATEDELVVHLQTGSVRGGSQKRVFGLNLEYFLGIPYAAAPVGALRFSPPQPVQPWEGVRDAANYRARCPQNEDSFPRNITVGMFRAFWGSLNATLEKFENAPFFLPSILIRHENGAIRKRWFHDHNPKTKMAGYFWLFKFLHRSVQNADCGLQTADCRPGTKCRLDTKCRLQTAD